MRVASAQVRAAACFAALLVAGALGEPGHGRADPLTITRWSVDGGGTTFFQLGPLVMGTTIGQPDAGRLIGVGYSISGGFWIPGAPMPVDVDETPPGPTTPRALVIHPAFPNPARLGTQIAFDLPDERDGAVRIFDLRGGLVRTVASGRFAAGPHRLEWDGHDAAGRRAPAGVYLVRIQLGALERTQKLAVMR